jgi:hypothetical protein
MAGAPPPSRESPSMWLVLVAGVLGTIHWVLFFGAGGFDMSVADWPRHAAYFSVWREALTTARLPIEVSVPIFDLGTKYLANLEVSLAPHSLFFALAGNETAALASAVFMSWIGVYGCVRLSRRLQLSALSFSLLTLLIGFNGYVVAHIGAGHLAWLGCYLFPFLIEALLLLVSGADDRRAAVGAALTVFAMLLIGAIHLAAASLGFMALAFLCVPIARAGLRRAAALFALLSAIRTLPAAFAFWSGGRPWFADGYRSPWQLLEGLLFINAPTYAPVGGLTMAYGTRSAFSLMWWEFDAYVGVVGLLLLVVFGVAPSVKAVGPPVAGFDRGFKALRLPILFFVLLSCGRLFTALVPAPVSLLSVERVPSRFLGLALACVLVMACARFDVWWRARPRSRGDRGLVYGAFLIAVAQLAYHSYTYSPARGSVFPVTLEGISPVIVASSGGAYPIALAIGAVVTVCSLIWAVRVFVQEKRAR